jgi:GTP-binding protein
MFVDQVKILVKAGDGGRGCASFRREARVPRGGPDGGNGGPGGGVLLRAVSHHNTLLPLRYHTEFRAGRGRHGGSSRMSGAAGRDVFVDVPPGTLAFDLATGEALGEVLRAGECLPLARGGRGGRGNAAFLSNRNRAPREAEGGQPGEERWLRLELRLIADVGLVGAPNAGKSTLLSRLSAARPRIGSYPFTTVHPVLGTVEEDGESVVVADIPGIVAGAHRGAGLGLQFLRHVERTRALAFVVDASGADPHPVSALRAVEDEIGRWLAELLRRPWLVVATKRDAVAGEDPLPELQAEADRRSVPLLAVSALRGEGVGHLKRALVRLVAPGRPEAADGARS